MDIKNIFAVLGALIALLCTVPYIIDVLKRKTKPNIITWIVWTLLVGIGAAALFASHDYNAAWLLVGDTIATFAVVVVGIKYGTAVLDKIDIVFFIGAIVGMILWFVFNSPIIAIIATIGIDFIGTIPTVRHSFRHPEEETYITFALGIVATLFTLLSLSDYRFSAWIYPAYLLLSNGLLTVTIFLGQRKKN
jgi:hypothetical protein